MTLPNNNILIIGAPGSGKTWVMKHLLSRMGKPRAYQMGLLWFIHNTRIAVTGKYTGSMYDGSDALSMAVMKEVPRYLAYAEKNSLTTFWEGDRFTNSKFIDLANPFIIKITDNGMTGRLVRGSNQTERHIKSITTRVANITPDLELGTSEETKSYICNHYF